MVRGLSGYRAGNEIRVLSLPVTVVNLTAFRRAVFLDLDPLFALVEDIPPSIRRRQCFIDV